MAIDKKALKKRYAKNVYKKAHSKKSSAEAYWSMSSGILSGSEYSRNESANETVSKSAVQNAAEAAYLPLKHTVSQVSSGGKSQRFTGSRQVSNTPVAGNADFIRSASGVGHTSSYISEAENISYKSNFISDINGCETDSYKSESNTAVRDRQRKQLYSRNRKKLFKRLREKRRYEKLAKTKNMNIKKSILKSLVSKKIFAVILGIFLAIGASILPIILFFSALMGTSSNFMDGYMGDVYATYPADENDITRVNLHWQTLIQNIKRAHGSIPSTVTEHYDRKNPQTADIMDDNHKLLSFLSAYYGSWTFDEVEDFITQIFSEMYAVEYGFTSETKKQTNNIQLEASQVPNPLPENYKIVSTYTYNGKNMYVILVTEDVTTVTLNYSITEKKTFDDIINEYLNDGQKDLYKNYYERKGGAIKAFSSPFAFDWSNTVTSPFGYRDWGGGNVEFHKGVDFGVPNGTEILAVADGTVQVGTGCTHNYPKDGSCGCNGGFGNYVEIYCENGTLILYGHMSQVAVQNGQTVKNGQVIGYSGCTGWSTGYHLHLQMVKDGEYIDPLIFIRPYTGAPAETEKEEN